MFRRHLAPLLLIAGVIVPSACSRAPAPDRVQASASSAPPEPRQETVGRPPRDGYVWVAGYWNLVNGRHVWVPGFWARPPRGFSSWDAAHWVRSDENGWVLVRGRWK